MSLRKSLHSVLKENGQHYSTDKEILLRIMKGDYETLLDDVEMISDVKGQPPKIDMKKIDQEGFMSDELPKFFLGGLVDKAKSFGKSFFSGSSSNPSKYTTGKNLNVMKYIGAQQNQNRGISGIWNSFKNSNLGSRVVGSYNTLTKKGGVGDFVGGLIDKVKGNLPGGTPDTPGYVPDKDVRFDPMKIKGMTLSKKQAAGHTVKAAGIPPQLRGKFVQTALANTQRPQYNRAAPSNLAGWTLTALNSPTYTGTKIGIEKGTRDDLGVTPMQAPTVNLLS